MTQFVTGGTPQAPLVQYGWRTNSPLLGTSYIYDWSNAGQIILRSNYGAAMSDTLPKIARTNINGEFGQCFNGWFFTVKNVDSVAQLSLTIPAGVTVNTSNLPLIIFPGQQLVFYSDGVSTFNVDNYNVNTSVITVTAGSVTYAANLYETKAVRENGGTAMTDTLPAITTVPFGWSILISNVDTVASDTVTPAAGTINGGASLVIPHNKSATIWSDGSQYWSTNPV